MAVLSNKSWNFLNDIFLFDSQPKASNTDNNNYYVHFPAFIFVLLRFQGSFHMTIFTWREEGTQTCHQTKEANSIRTIKLKPVMASTCHRNNVINISCVLLCVYVNFRTVMLSIQIYTV